MPGNINKNNAITIRCQVGDYKKNWLDDIKDRDVASCNHVTKRYMVIGSNDIERIKPVVLFLPTGSGGCHKKGKDQATINNKW